MDAVGQAGWRGAVLAVLVGVLLGSAGCASPIGLQPQLGQKITPTRIVVGPVLKGRYDYVVHLSGNHKLDDRAYRLGQARKEMADRCPVVDLVDLYAHQVGAWQDGSARLSYAIGVKCHR